MKDSNGNPLKTKSGAYKVKIQMREEKNKSHFGYAY